MSSSTSSNSDIDAPEAKPRTAVVLGLLAGTSLVFSYLGAYAVSGALVEADVLPSWSAGDDPRPRWLATSFAVLMTSFLCLGGLARFLSRRQMRQIDEMGDESVGA